ncbi:MAG: apolipoprotein N-acyltransferase [Pirellulaceae bacterium]|nr:apolipoprotein N-acyltransferase [Pirellulaceae bacterium]
MPGEGRSREAGWYRSTWFLGLLGGVLLLAAFPPWSWWPLAWLAPVAWLYLVRLPRLGGKWPYLTLWSVSLLHWLALLQGIRLAHWATYFGWVALCLYLACYLPAFVALARVAVHRMGWPLWVAGPVIWTGLELLRGYLLTGFSLALLGHSQVSVLPVIQVADLGGAYLVSCLIMLVAAAIAGCIPAGQCRRIGWPALAGVAVSATIAAAAIIYGCVRIGQDDAELPVAGDRGWQSVKAGGTEGRADERLTVALIQRSAETIFEFNAQRNLDIYYQYRELTLAAVERHTGVQLIVWPESVYTANIRELLFDGPPEPPPGLEMSPAEFQQTVERWQLAFQAKNRDLAEAIRDVSRASERSGVAGSSQTPPEGDAAGPWLLVGTDVEYVRDRVPHFYNTAMLLDARGGVAGRYFKMHPVMFGEYVPLADWLPWLYRLTPLTQGLSAGREPQGFEVAGFRLCPNICFESTVPHLIRRQVRVLERRGESPDILVSITNDGWFRGSSILDLHLACAVFRSVEHRRPSLIAANTGITAWIDGSGRVLDRIGALRDDYLVASVARDRRSAWYTRLGDLPAGLCLAATVAVGVAGCFRRQRLGRSRP